MPLATALRVLAAINEKRLPQPADIEFLRTFALPTEADLMPDDLAAEIIKRELANRKRNDPYEGRWRWKRQGVKPGVSVHLRWPTPQAGFIAPNTQDPPPR
jgi:hypothetical protein